MGTENELRHFEALYDRAYDPADATLTDTWDSQADKWDRKYRAEEERELHEVRIRDTAAWLRAQGLLGSEQDVADVGCGPGRYAAEFAKTARSVMGTDISPKMTLEPMFHKMAMPMDIRNTTGARNVSVSRSSAMMEPMMATST